MVIFRAHIGDQHRDIVFNEKVDQLICAEGHSVDAEQFQGFFETDGIQPAAGESFLILMIGPVVYLLLPFNIFFLEFLHDREYVEPLVMVQSVAVGVDQCIFNPVLERN